ncbi:hypothetical protein Pmani_006434 [Petrolisthes manimaculis]|uniref:Uncharacterized protein n=1 Tax=Petrolisthes manimaculis TaxID=1843537 RepID=A0AAE1QAD9_9EUCA|nr:hypothetical protein Pmani_006434 [Petrolisthes manimaculis]
MNKKGEERAGGGGMRVEAGRRVSLHCTPPTHNPCLSWWSMAGLAKVEYERAGQSWPEPQSTKQLKREGG